MRADGDSGHLEERDPGAEHRRVRLRVPPIPRIILERRHPSATLAWMLGIALLPLVGIPLYFLIGVRRVRRHIRAKIAAVAPVVSSLSRSGRDPRSSPTDIGERCGQVLLAAGTPPPTEGNRATFLRGGDEAHQVLLPDRIRAGPSARASSSSTSTPSGEGSSRRSPRGRGKGSASGCCSMPWGRGGRCEETVRPLREAGGEVAAFMPAFPLHRRWSAHLRNHRKLLIADGRKAFTGGMNIGKKYMGPRTTKAQWRDVAAVIEGPSLRDLQSLFLDDWAFATEETLPAGDLFPSPCLRVAPCPRAPSRSPPRGRTG